MSKKKFVDVRPQYIAKPGAPVDLSALETAETGYFDTPKQGKKELKRYRKVLSDLQERFYAWNKKSLLIVLQGMDTAGKDGTIRHVMSGVNPQGVVVTPFKVPTPEERAHDYLWRIHKAVPKRSMIGIFNRSYYEDVLVVRVHDLVPPEVWGQRYDQINAFEKFLTDNDVIILKFFLHISKEEQARRLQARLDTPAKRWKFSKADLKERGYWDDYITAYTDAVQKCSTDHAPWYVVPSDVKWYRNYVVGQIITATLYELDPQFPQPEEGLDDIVIT
jgi:PPK2 family polyphosphate:nucleotide phosphotransferase